MPKSYRCAVCGRTHLKQRRPNKTIRLKRYVTKRINREIQSNGVICDKCRAAYRKTVTKSRTTQKQASLNEGAISDKEDAEFVVNIESTTSEVLRSLKHITLHVQLATSSISIVSFAKNILAKQRNHVFFH